MKRNLIDEISLFKDKISFIGLSLGVPSYQHDSTTTSEQTEHSSELAIFMREKSDIYKYVPKLRGIESIQS
jgi:hypothetical protein